MSDQKADTETKRLPKGLRKHLRRLKSEARKDPNTPVPQSVPGMPSRAPKKKDKPDKG